MGRLRSAILCKGQRGKCDPAADRCNIKRNARRRSCDFIPDACGAGVDGFNDSQINAWRHRQIDIDAIDIVGLNTIELRRAEREAFGLRARRRRESSLADEALRNRCAIGAIGQRILVREYGLRRYKGRSASGDQIIRGKHAKPNGIGRITVALH